MKDEEIVKLFKCLGDMTRLQILKSLLKEDMYVERLAERLGLTPATISFHLKKLMEVGAVVSRKEQYYTMYSVCKSVFQPSVLRFLTGASDNEEDQLSRERSYRRSVIDHFFRYGKLVSIPAQRKKKRICLEVIVERFEKGCLYDERQVNEILKEYHEDSCTLRRDMISERLMSREGTTYVRIE